MSPKEFDDQAKHLMAEKAHWARAVMLMESCLRANGFGEGMDKLLESVRKASPND